MNKYGKLATGFIKKYIFLRGAQEMHQDLLVTNLMRF